MTAWLPPLRAVDRRVARAVEELVLSVTDRDGAKALVRTVIADLEATPYPSALDIATAVARRCVGGPQRSALAAYLHLVHDNSLNTVATVFAVDVAAARRLVERGSGSAPVTTGEECRGWVLVAPRQGRTAAERHAAAGHLALCRRCRNRTRAHATIEHRVAAAGSATFGVSVVAAIGRAFAGQSASAATGALSGPILTLSTAAALTAGVGAVTVGVHRGDASPPPAGRHAHQQQQRPAAPSLRSTPAAVSRDVPAAQHTTHARAQHVGSSPAPGPGLLPTDLPKAPAVHLPLPLPTSTKVPLPLPTVSLPAIPPVHPPVHLPVPTPTISLPPLP